MSIKTNQTTDLILIGSSDTTLLNPTQGRAGISFGSLHEQTGAAETVELFVSTDGTSAAGERIDTLTFAADETKNPISMTGRAIKQNQFLLAKATTGNLVSATVSYTQYSGDS